MTAQIIYPSIPGYELTKERWYLQYPRQKDESDKDFHSRINGIFESAVYENTQKQRFCNISGQRISVEVVVKEYTVLKKFFVTKQTDSTISRESPVSELSKETYISLSESESSIDDKEKKIIKIDYPEACYRVDKYEKHKMALIIFSLFAITSAFFLFIFGFVLVSQILFIGGFFLPLAPASIIASNQN